MGHSSLVGEGHGYRIDMVSSSPSLIVVPGHEAMKLLAILRLLLTGSRSTKRPEEVQGHSAACVDQYYIRLFATVDVGAARMFRQSKVLFSLVSIILSFVILKKEPVENGVVAKANHSFRKLQ